MTKPPKIDPPEAFMVDGASQVRIPLSLAKNVAPVLDFMPNPWNPNHMDAFVRERLAKSIRKDGFIVPLIVRPNPAGDSPKWQIIDGEHRWLVASQDLNMTSVPYVNIGPVSDTQAKEITIKANTLKGDFDSVQLAKIVAELVELGGMTEVSSDLPFSADRLQSMIDLLQVNVTSLSPDAPAPGKDAGADDDPKKPRAAADKSFKAFDPSEMEFTHNCPRCGFGFNADEKAGLGAPNGKADDAD